MNALITLFFHLFFTAPTGVVSEGPSLEAPHCDLRGARMGDYTDEERSHTRKRVQAVCHHVGASPIVCAYLDAVVVRESGARPGVRHTQGVGEDGLGAMGLSLKWHRDKWPGNDEDPMFCHPEVSALVTLAIMRRSFNRYRTRNITEVQAIFGGSWSCSPTGGRNVCRAHPRRVQDICHRMDSRGFACDKGLQVSDLGREVPFHLRRKVAARLVQTYNRRLSKSSV